MRRWGGRHGDLEHGQLWWKKRSQQGSCGAEQLRSGIATVTRRHASDANTSGAALPRSARRLHALQHGTVSLNTTAAAVFAPQVGTPYYVSPEVVRGAGYDWKSDVWSMGCLLYELALLRSPFEMEGANLYDVFQKISKGEYTPLPADQFSAPLRSLVGRMLQIDPAKRPELEEVRCGRVWSVGKLFIGAVRSIVCERSGEVDGRGRARVAVSARKSAGRLGVTSAGCSKKARCAGTKVPGVTSCLHAVPPWSPASHRAHAAPGILTLRASRPLHLPLLLCPFHPHPPYTQVWNITSNAVQSQARTRSDVHGAAAEAYETLVLLSGEVAARLRGKAPPSTPPNGLRRTNSSSSTTSAPAPSAGATSGILSPPPLDTIRSLHPLYFSEPLVPSLRSDADMFQKQQLGAFLHVLAWLMRLNGKSDAASAIEAHLELVPAPHTPSARLSAASRPASSTPAASASSSTKLPMCTNILKGAEAAKKGAQVLGLSTEFAPVNALALGHGRAVCGLLQDALAVAVQRVPLAVRPLGRTAEPPAEEVAEELPDGALEGAADSVLTAAGGGRAGGGGGLAGDEDDEDEAEYAGLRLGAGGGARSAGGKGAGAGRGGKAGGAGAGGATKVDPLAWRTELERLTPQLNRIRIPAELAAGDWALRWRQTKEQLGTLAAAAPDVGAGLGRLGGAVAHDLDRVDTTERRLNANTAELLGGSDAARMWACRGWLHEQRTGGVLMHGSGAVCSGSKVKQPGALGQGMG